MSDEIGRVVYVSTLNEGDGLADDTPAGSTVLTLGTSVDFEETGGTLDIDDVQHVYASADHDAGTVTLATPTAADYAAGEAVRIFPLAPVTTAMVQIGGDEDVITARIPLADVPLWVEGPRGEVEQESVGVSLIDGEWILDDVAGKPAIIDGSSIDPDTLPPAEPIIPDPPAASPTPTAEPFAILSLKVTVPSGEPTDSFDVYAAPATGVTEDPALFVGTVPAVGAPFIFAKLADGTPLSTVDPTFIAIVAHNAGGRGPLSVEVSATARQATTGDIAAEFIAALRAEFVSVDVAELSAITSNLGDVIARQIRIPDGDGYSFNASAADGLVLDGNVSAREFFAKNGGKIEGDLRFAPGSSVTAEASLSAPASVGTVTGFSETVELDAPGFAPSTNITVRPSTGNLAALMYSQGTGPRVRKYMEFDPDTGAAVVDQVITAMGTSPRSAAWVGDDLYILHAREYESGATFCPVWKYTPGMGYGVGVGDLGMYASTSSREPGLGSDGTNLLVGLCVVVAGTWQGISGWQAGECMVLQIPPSGISLSPTWTRVLKTGQVMGNEIASITKVPAFDLTPAAGKTAMVVSRKYAPSSSGAFGLNHLMFDVDATGSGCTFVDGWYTSELGLAWDGSRFYGLDNMNVVRKFEAKSEAGAFPVSQTYHTAGSFETDQSPQKVWTFFNRLKHRFTADPVPVFPPENTDAPNRVRVYVGRTSPRDYMERQITATIVPGEPVSVELPPLVLPAGSGYATNKPPFANGYDTSTQFAPAVFTYGPITISSDGSGQLGSGNGALKWGPDGSGTWWDGKTGRALYAKISNDADQSLGTSYTAVTFPDTDRDNSGMRGGPGGNSLVVPAGEAGWYVATAHMDFSTMTGTPRRMLEIIAGTASMGRQEINATGYLSLTVSGEAYLTAGTAVSVQTYMSVAGVAKGTYTPTTLTLRRVG